MLHTHKHLPTYSFSFHAIPGGVKKFVDLQDQGVKTFYTGQQIATMEGLSSNFGPLQMTMIVEKPLVDDS